MKMFQCFFFFSQFNILGAIALVIAACVLNFKRAIGLLVIACSAVFFLIWDGIMERYGEQMWDGMYPIRHFFSSNWYWMKWWETLIAHNVLQALQPLKSLYLYFDLQVNRWENLLGFYWKTKHPTQKKISSITTNIQFGVHWVVCTAPMYLPSFISKNISIGVKLSQCEGQVFCI